MVDGSISSSDNGWITAMPQYEKFDWTLTEPPVPVLFVRVGPRWKTSFGLMKPPVLV